MKERLTPLAATFLDIEDEDQKASLAIGSMAIFEGPAPSFEEFVKVIEGRPAAGLRAIGAEVRSPRHLAAKSALTAKGLLSISRSIRPATDSSLTGSLDGGRRHAWTTC